MVMFHLVMLLLWLLSLAVVACVVVEESVVPLIESKDYAKPEELQVHFKGTNTFRTQLVNPKDKDPKTHKSGIIYHDQCPHINCPEAYMGESGRALGQRVKEHLKAPSPNLPPKCINRTSFGL